MTPIEAVQALGSAGASRGGKFPTPRFLGVSRVAQLTLMMVRLRRMMPELAGDERRTARRLLDAIARAIRDSNDGFALVFEMVPGRPGRRETAAGLSGESGERSAS